MFKIESYVTPILLSYVDKYVRDFKPADAQVSLWGGGVALHNLVLKADVLQQEVSLPFTLVSGRIHELLIQVPWTKIMSEPIIVTIDTIECVLSLNPPDATDETPPPDSPSRKAQVVEAPPGYMQALVRRIVSNIALRIHHLIVKYVQDDIVLSLNVKHLAVDSAGADWEPSFADIDQAVPVIRRLVRLDDLTLCLDRADSDGKIRFYQEPLLYRCQLDLRVLTRLVSANTRRASSLSVQLRSTKLAWGVTSDQLTLLLRLTRERSSVEQKQSPPAPKAANVTQVAPIHTNSSNSAEPARSESWSEWAWSWMPAWIDREGGVEEAAMSATPTPVHFTAYLDDVSVVFKVMELEGNTRKRARVVLELSASHAAAKSFLCSPTTVTLKIGARDLRLCSHGKCVCGYIDYCGINDEPTIYMRKIESHGSEEAWKWPEGELNEYTVETAEVAQEGVKPSADSSPDLKTAANEQTDPGLPEEPPAGPQGVQEESDELWRAMEPLIYFEYSHDRAPPDAYDNPYDDPPKDFQYSDWSEECNIKIQLQPVEIKICPGLIHRLTALRNIFKELPPVPIPELPMRILTVEECDALSDNLPQWRASVETKGLRIRILPWDHQFNERPSRPPIVLDVEVPKSLTVLTGPLYPHRVCSAACQMPDDVGPLWQGARLHLSASFTSVEVKICSPDDSQPRPCARADLRFVTHFLLNKEYFKKRESVVFSYSVKIREANVYGSCARLQAAWQIPLSLITQKPSLLLKYTTLAKDAISDEDSVVVDMTVEDLSVRGYMTRHINTHIVSLQTAKATTLHEMKTSGLKQAWLFSGPESPTTTPYLRAALQWCSSPIPTSLDYVGIWMEPTAVCVDPLFIALLAYKPTVRPQEAPSTLSIHKISPSAQYFLRRRATPPSSSGRGASRSGSGADMVHVRTRSVGSSSEPSEKKDRQPQQQDKPPEEWWTNERLLAFHERLKHMLVNVEIGLMLAYVTITTASALDCATVRDAMERHANDSHGVLALSLGRLSMHSSSVTKHLWHDIRHDGPTFVVPRPDQNQSDMDSFPWRMRIADMSCYTLEVNSSLPLAKERSSGGLRSQLKVPCAVTPRTVLELVSTTVTLSVVTKAIQIKTVTYKETKKHSEPVIDDEKLKYFKTGMDFKPSTLKEFVRGPARRKKPEIEKQETKPEPAPQLATSMGPVVSLGVHLHADTPPLIVRLDHAQVHMVSATLHCFNHILTLLQKQPLVLPRQSFTTLGGSHRSLIRSVSEMEDIQSQSEDTQSENRSDLIPIFQSHLATGLPHKLKTFFWFQWVVSRMTVVVTTPQAKLAFDIDDIISTVDLQTHYNQLKVKVASASVRHYERIGSDEWMAGVLGGRVLEAREPTDAKEDNHFLAVTVTQAQISNLPASWKEELHPKLLEQKNAVDSMWEIYATLAPLEMVLQPIVLEHAITLMRELAPRSFCPLQSEVHEGVSTWQWPFCYVTAGGLRLLVTCENQDPVADDTFMFVIGKITVNPHPENPICRRAVNGGADAGWLAAGGGYEGRQYDILVKNVGIRSAQFKQLVNEETSEAEILKGTGGENPALKWTQPVVSPVITPVLHAVDVGCVLAPALYIGGALVSGPAVELNLLSDCAIELSLEHLGLLRRLTGDMTEAVNNSYSLSAAYNEENRGVCSYATLLMARHNIEEAEGPFRETILTEETSIHDKSEADKSLGADSGIDTSFSKSSRLMESSSLGIKKTVSIAVMEPMAAASDYLEVYVTMGTIDLSLYTVDNSTPEVIALRPPKTEFSSTPEQCVQTVSESKNNSEKARDEDMSDSLQGSRSRSLSDNIRIADITKTKIEFNTIFPHARKSEGNLPLLHVSLQQPNLYYFRKKSQKNLQVSLFNAWVGLGAGMSADHWHAALFSTAKGAPDPVTDIPPALATMKIVGSSGGTGYLPSTSSTSSKGSIRLDIERPILVEVCTDRLRRIKGITELIKNKISEDDDNFSADAPELPFFYRLKRLMIHQCLESITLQTSQMGVSGSEGTVGWDSASLQVTASTRPDRLSTRGAITALLVATGPPGDRRHVLLHPLMLGMDLEATWEAWRRAEGGLQAREPTVRIGLEVDRVILDLRPADLATLQRIKQALGDDMGDRHRPPPAPVNSSETLYRTQHHHPSPSSSIYYERKLSSASLDAADCNDHYYKDDLRSGAFKILSGGQLPMAYQVMLHGSSVSWRYPHPRAITRVVAFPIPGLDQEVRCVLELYSPMLGNWEPHTYFDLPVGEPRELQLYAAPPDAVFAQMWRFRVCLPNESQEVPFEFNITKFMPKNDTLSGIQDYTEKTSAKHLFGVTAEQLSGVLRVDSYFAPRQLPCTRVVLRVSALELHAHNSIPFLSSQVTALEGYYVSRPLMRSHRVLTVMARDITGHAQLGSSAGYLLLADGNLSADIMDCATGTMEQLVDEFRFQSGLAVARKGSNENPRTRIAASKVHVALHVPRLRTLHALATDWSNALDDYIKESRSTDTPEVIKSKREVAAATAAALEGRVSLWIHNSCAAALRIGQEETDEVVPLGPGARLAYRWRNPNSVKRLRFALAGPTADWHWSASIPFSAGTNRIRLEDAEVLGSTKQSPGAGVFLHTKVEEVGARRSLHLAGRLALANMLRFNLLYKVRARCSETNLWRTVCSGELVSETVGRSVICGADCEMVLKIKFTCHDTGWSGDIPLKECPKENVPWLVKVPSEGEVPYMSVWCRVVRGRTDGRILATIWPLYVLHSHLPLDIDVLITTNTGLSSAELEPGQTNPPPRIQTASGRGTSTHLLAPGTTAARHSLSFQYRNIECPVTREAVPLHYGVTDTSVFDKRTPIASIEQVIDNILEWLAKSGRNAVSTWPYSIVSKHWSGQWQPALLQPRCDVTVCYRAVRAGGGCSLELQLCPVVLLCNAASIALTLRANDAAPLCKLEPGSVISPPSIVMKKPFFMSVEMGRETFVSGQLQVCTEEPGRYGEPPPGQVALDRSADFAIQCNHKVALLTMYFEIKEGINVLGVSSTYILINRLDTDIMVSAVAIPKDVDEEPFLRSKSLKVVPPVRDGSINGVALCKFWLRGRWRGSDPSELNMFLSVALSVGPYLSMQPVPVRLGAAPVRRAIALTDCNKLSVPVVITQIKLEGRWVVVVAKDPCPQFIVHNRTKGSLAVAQPVHTGDEPSSSRVAAVSECSGTNWWCVIPPQTMTHYSTPAHCARYPPQSTNTSKPFLPFLVFAKAAEGENPDWCPPVAITDGEQLLQMKGGATVKLCVRTHPHSTHLELQDVDQNDISASDIRRRLFKAFNSVLSVKSAMDERDESARLERTDGDVKLLERAAHHPPDQSQLTFHPKTETPDTSSGSTSTATLTKSAVIFKTEEMTPDSSTVTTMSGCGPLDHTESAELKVPSEGISCDTSCALRVGRNPEWDEDYVSVEAERLRCVIAGVAIEMSASADTLPLLALHVDRAALLVVSDTKKTKTTLSIADVQIDNLQYETGQYDFAVIASTRAEPLADERWPPLWCIFCEREAYTTRQAGARVLLTAQQDKWNAMHYNYKELTEVEVRVGPLALYIEDAYVKALVELSRLAIPSASACEVTQTLAEERSLQSPLRLRNLHIHPLDLTLTLHTAIRMYIALDQSPLRLSAFRLTNAMTSTERLTHALTVHYLSAAILGAGWVVGGLELLGAPGALAARVGGATGGVRGVASAAAAALLRSLSAWAGSLARNLDLLAGDEEHARRAAAARRRPPPSFVAGLVAGITNFAINVLGAVGGLAHHPLVGVAVGETESGAAALRRGLLGALTKPLSATADLVAYAGHGLLNQTGWDPVPQPRSSWPSIEPRTSSGWRRDCVRWTFRLAELTALAGFEVLLDNAPLQLLLTHKFLVVADPDSERIVEMIDLRFCTLAPFQGRIIELCVTQKRQTKMAESRAVDEDDEYQISAAAMARVARYTGAEGTPATEARILSLLPVPCQAHALHAVLAAAIHNNADSYFPLL